MISLQLITTILTAIIKFTHRLTSYQYYSSFVIALFQLSIEVYTMGKWLPVVHTAPCCYALCSFQHHTLQKPKHWSQSIMARCHMSGPPMLKTCLHGNTVPSTSMKQACLPWWPFFLQHILTAVMQQSRYPIFNNGDTPIQLGLLWQSSPTLLLSVSYYWNLYLGQYTKILSISYISYSYIRLVVTL